MVTPNLFGVEETQGIIGERKIMASLENNRLNSGKIGLVLGSGSARGWAHIGVIQALTEAGIDIDYIVGTSIGSVVGSVFAAGNIGTLEEVAVQLDWKQIAYLFDVVLPKSGLIDGKKVAGFVRNHLKKTNIEELPIPFCAISTDLNTGDEVVIREGDIIEAVRASISIPVVYLLISPAISPTRPNDMNHIT